MEDEDGARRGSGKARGDGETSDGARGAGSPRPGYGLCAEGRPGSRDGCRGWPRDARAGEIALRVPRPRRGSCLPRFPEPRRAAERAPLAVVREARLQSVSTRAVEEPAEALSASGVSRRGARGWAARSRSRSGPRSCGTSRPGAPRREAGGDPADGPRPGLPGRGPRPAAAGRPRRHGAPEGAPAHARERQRHERRRDGTLLRHSLGHDLVPMRKTRITLHP